MLHCRLLKVFILNLGKTVPLDVFSCFSKGKIQYSHLNLTYGLIADIDIESEKYRWLGALRLTIAGLAGIVSLRTYHGSIFYLPADETAIDKEKEQPNVTLESLAPDSGLIPKTYPSHNGPKLSLLLQDYTKWPGAIVKKAITTFNCTNLSWIASDFLATPFVKLGSGFMDLVYSSSDLTKTSTLGSFLDTSRGQYLKTSAIHRVLVKGLVLIPDGLIGKNGLTDDGHFSLSGESIDVAPIRLEIHPGVLNICVPEHLNEDKWLALYS